MQRQVGADRVLRVRDDDDVYRVKEWFFQEKVQVAEKIEEENNNKCKNEKQNLRKSVQQAFKEKIERERERERETVIWKKEKQFDRDRVQKRNILV